MACSALTPLARRGWPGILVLEKMAGKKGEDKNSKINGENLKILAVSKAGSVNVDLQVEKRRR